MSMLLTLIGKNIRTMREEQGFSQEGFAFHAGVARTYMGRVERGEQNMTMTILAKFCSALRCNPQCILPDYLVIKKLENIESDHKRAVRLSMQTASEQSGIGELE